MYLFCLWHEAMESHHIIIIILIIDSVLCSPSRILPVCDGRNEHKIKQTPQPSEGLANFSKPTENLFQDASCDVITTRVRPWVYLGCLVGRRTWLRKSARNNFMPLRFRRFEWRSTKRRFFKKKKEKQAAKSRTFGHNNDQKKTKKQTTQKAKSCTDWLWSGELFTTLCQYVIDDHSERHTFSCKMAHSVLHVKALHLHVSSVWNSGSCFLLSVYISVCAYSLLRTHSAGWDLGGCSTPLTSLIADHVGLMRRS